MLVLAQNENYEEAAKVRDQIAMIKDLEVKVEIDIAKLEDFEVFALAFKIPCFQPCVLWCKMEKLSVQILRLLL